MTAANKDFFEALSMLEHERGITAEYLIEKIKAAIREPYRLKDAEVQVGTSCGCAVYPCDSDDVRAIRILADHRMYEDKQRSGRSCE